MTALVTMVTVQLMMRGNLATSPPRASIGSHTHNSCSLSAHHFSTCTMFTSGRSEMVTKIVGDINATLVRKLEDLEHRVLMRIENLQRYEEQTMATITARVDALERSSNSMRFQNEMIQVLERRGKCWVVFLLFSFLVLLQSL